MTDYWKKYDETRGYLHPEECRSRQELENRILEDFYGGNEVKYGKSARELSKGLWRMKPYKEGVRKMQGDIIPITFHYRSKKTGKTRSVERTVLRDSKTGRFKKWL